MYLGRSVASNNKKLKQALALKAPEFVIESLKKRMEGDSSFEVIPDCWLASELFLYLSSDWQIISGFSSVAYRGIPSSEILSVVSAAGLSGKKAWKAYRQIKLMERGALSVLNERK